MKKATLGMMLTLLLTSVFALELSVRSVKLESTILTYDDVSHIIDRNQGITSLPPIDWIHYHDYTEIVAILLALNETYPNIIDVFSIGKSWWNRDIYCVRLTNESDQKVKPEVLFVGYHHAREIISSELTLYFVVYAATNFGSNGTITELINNCEIYVVVALNVDGFDLFEANEWQRKNARPIDEDNDGLFDEDPPDDEDGDGYVEDLWQQEVFIRYEGVDDDGDDLLNEDFVGGVDLNRNYGYQWNATVQSGSTDPSAEDYRGPAPFSEPETQAIKDLSLQYNFKYAISFHSGAESIVYPWGYTTLPSPDKEIFNDIASQLSSLIGCWHGQSGAWYTTSGVWDDWMYGNRNVLSLTCEIYTNSSAWQYEPGPYNNSLWEKGIFQFFNPAPNNIETVIQRWLPVFPYVINRAISEAYDVTITNMTTMKAIIGQGYPITINITAKNQGFYSEVFNLTAYANKTIIDTLANITLAIGDFKNITFLWNTTDFVKGNYMISAYATPVDGETKTANNNFTYGFIKLTVPGDFDGDFDVGSADFALLAVAYGSTPRKPGLIGYWNPNCDVDCNNKVGPFDFAVLCVNYGKHYP